MVNYMKSPNAAHAIRAIPLSSRAGDLFSYASAVQDFQKYLSLQKRAGPLLTGGRVACKPSLVVSVSPVLCAVAASDRVLL